MSLNRSGYGFKNEIDMNWGRTESAGINRHRVEGVSPLHE